MDWRKRLKRPGIMHRNYPLICIDQRSNYDYLLIALLIFKMRKQITSGRWGTPIDKMTPQMQTSKAIKQILS